MSFKSFLKKAGEDVLEIITFGAVVAKDAAPFIGIANPALGALIAATTNAVIAAEAAGTSAVAGAPSTTNGAQKAALAITAISPSALAFTKAIGAPEPTQEQLQAWINDMVAALNVFQVPIA